MVQNQSLDQFGITGQSMNHMHNLDHMEIDGSVLDFHNIYSLHNNIDKLVGQIWVQFCVQCCSGHTC